MSEDACPAYERELTGGRVVIGVDEVGRGPLAGPVVAAAAVLPTGLRIAGLKDSKKLAAKRRDALTETLLEQAQVALGAASARVIDELGIERATHLAMQRAVAQVAARPDALVLVDGNRAPDFGGRDVLTEVKADASCPSVSAAAVIAKVTRDLAMVRLAQRYGAYGWHTNKGYGSAAHREAIVAIGVTEHHRRSFLTKILA